MSNCHFNCHALFGGTNCHRPSSTSIRHEHAGQSNCHSKAVNVHA